MNYKDLLLLKQIKSQRLERKKRELARQTGIVDQLTEDLDGAMATEADAKKIWSNARATRLVNLLAMQKLLPEIEREQRDELKQKQSWLDQLQSVQETRASLRNAESKLVEDSLHVSRLLKENEKFSHLCDSVMKTKKRNELKRLET